jgi:phosphate starvation-inducible PhoH-like protein
MNNKKLRFENNGHLDNRLSNLFDEIAKRRPVKLFHGPRAKTEGQRSYMEGIDNNEIVFATGPAGCGKTHLAVGKAVEGLKEDGFRKIIAIRPCLGVGKTMGYLPGVIEAKVLPYLRPIMDELRKFFTPEEMEKLQKLDILELGSIEHIRGRTLEDAFIILDEAQNCTDEELAVFITRLGMGSHMVINGDISRYREGHDKAGRYTQCDLALQPYEVGAFERQCNNLQDIESIMHIQMTPLDVVRHPLIKKITERGL